MMRLYQRYFCYGSAVTTVAWISVIFLYLHIESMPRRSPFSDVEVQKQRLLPRYTRTRTTADVNDLESLGMIRSPEDQKKRDEGYKHYAFNVLVSDKLGLHRSIPDTRHERCRQQHYPRDLPSASIIICFYREATSTLLRTAASVIARAPPHLIHEVILVEDGADEHDPSDNSLEAALAAELPSVKLIRTPGRQGLIRARIFGADHATGEVLVFLDSHCEANADWLRPLLARIHDNGTRVVIPTIDLIDPDTFAYDASPLVRGGFNWGMHFRWDTLSPAQVTDPIAPIRTPTMAGGLFAMKRQYFIDLGKYDPGMDVWGGENLEISFRVWQCGGQLEILPCSRVGHVFRKRRPYGSPGGVDTMTHNSLRVVLVWMDEFKEFYYRVRPDARRVSAGNITSRLQLRRSLSCRPFRWYVKNVYPELTLPDAQGKGGVLPRGGMAGIRRALKPAPPVVRRGQLRHVASQLCVISENGIYDKKSLLKVAECTDSKDQQWQETADGYLLLAGVLCLSLDDSPRTSPYPNLMKCHYAKGSQLWHWTGRNKGQLLNPASGKCLNAKSGDGGPYVSMAICDETNTLLFEIANGR